MAWKRFPRGNGSQMRGEIRAAIDSAFSKSTKQPGARPYKRCIVTDDGQLLEEDLAHVLGKTGTKCASLHEGKRLCTLMLLKRAGEIVGDIEMHPRFALTTRRPDGLEERIGFYIADFRYTAKSGQVHVEDAKGWSGRDELYRWKKKHVEAQFGITIEEV